MVRVGLLKKDGPGSNGRGFQSVRDKGRVSRECTAEKYPWI
jgi:hypothetical protein